MDISPNRASARVDLRPAFAVARQNSAPMLRPDRLATRPLLASLRDFGRAGLRPTTPLQRTIVAALCIKLVMITALWAYVSLDQTRIVATDHAVARMTGVEPH